jgi:hypothetical protein
MDDGEIGLWRRCRHGACHRQQHREDLSSQDSSGREGHKIDTRFAARLIDGLHRKDAKTTLAAIPGAGCGAGAVWMRRAPAPYPMM